MSTGIEPVIDELDKSTWAKLVIVVMASGRVPLILEKDTSKYLSGCTGAAKGGGFQSHELLESQ